MNYLSQWKKATDERKGNFTPADRGKMFLSKATFEGLETTAYALIECVQFLLQNGFQYVLTNKFSQDPLEDHFGRHRGLGRRSCNPTVDALGHQENKLRLQRTIATSITPKGNTKGSKAPFALRLCNFLTKFVKHDNPTLIKKTLSCLRKFVRFPFALANF